MDFRLDTTVIRPDTECPACGTGLDLHWQTEYADPKNGVYVSSCPNCSEPIEITVEVLTNYYTKLVKASSY
jgi:hypothetical protein